MSTPLNDLTDFEREILEELAGLRTPSPWGAAVGAALEALRGFGLVTRAGIITPEGLRYLKGKDVEVPQP